MSERLYTFVVSSVPAMLDVMDGESVHDRIALQYESNEPPSIAFMNTVKSYCADNDPPLVMTSITPLAIQARPARNEVERTRARYSGDRLVSADDFKQLIEDAEQADHAAELSAEASDVEYDAEREAEAAESSDLRREEWVSARAGQLQRSGMGQGASRRQAREEAAAMTFPSRFALPYTAGASNLSQPPTWHKTRAEAEAWIDAQDPGSYYLNGPDASPSQGDAASTAIRREGEPDDREHEILTLAFRHCQARDDLPAVVAIERVMALSMIADEYVSAVRADDDVKLRVAEARLMRQVEPFLPNAELARSIVEPTTNEAGHRVRS